MESSRERERKPRSWTARVFATLALLVTALVIFLVIDGSMDDSSPDAGGEENPQQTTTTEACEVGAEKAVEAGYYVLKAGEDLSVVADKTCIELDELISLNPELDPQQLEIASCIDLRKNGCKALAEG